MRHWTFWRGSSARLTYPSNISTGQCFQFLKHTFACGNVAKPWRIPRNCNRYVASEASLQLMTLSTYILLSLLLCTWCKTINPPETAVCFVVHAYDPYFCVCHAACKHYISHVHQHTTFLSSSCQQSGAHIQMRRKTLSRWATNINCQVVSNSCCTRVLAS